MSPEPVKTPVPAVVVDDCATDQVTPLLRDEGRPLFNDSWEVEAFAMGRILVEEGTVSSSEWYDTIGAAIKAAQERGDPDNGDTYYQHWMAALERVCMDKGLFDEPTLHETQAVWMKAVANTPHGVPIRIENATAVPVAPAHRHHDAEGHAVDPAPLAVVTREG